MSAIVQKREPVLLPWSRVSRVYFEHAHSALSVILPVCLSCVGNGIYNYFALSFEPGFSRQSIALSWWCGFCTVLTYVCTSYKDLRPWWASTSCGEKANFFIRITAFRVVMWGIWAIYVMVNRLQRENGDQVQRIGRMENHGKGRTGPIILPREFICINKLRAQRPGLWVNCCGSKMWPIIDHIATVFDRISILASGQAIHIIMPRFKALSFLPEFDFLGNPTLGTVYFPNVLSVSWLGSFKVWYPVSCGCTCTTNGTVLWFVAYMYIQIHTCMHWCAWVNPMSCLCMYMHACMTWPGSSAYS